MVIPASPELEPCPHPQVGTSGWHYDHWRGPFYPEDLPQARWLWYYAKRFPCVEVNNSFYRFPSPQTICKWLDAVPRDFCFAIKASRYITHRKKLQDCRQSLQLFLQQATLFGDHLGPLLFQLPPRWHVNPGRLAGFVDMLPAGLKCTFEFRDPSWHTQEIYDLLAARGLAFCQFEIAGLRAPDVLTARLVYIRLHGPGPDAYRGSYPDEVLGTWAARIRRWRSNGRQVWVFFDNDEAGYAADDALRLLRMLGDTPGA